MVDADERDVVDLMRDVLQTRYRGLVFTGQVRELGVADVAADDLLDRRRGVEHLVDGQTGQRGAQHHTGAVAACLGGLQPDGFQPLPDLGYILDPDPVVLNVFPVGDVGGVPGELDGNLAERAQRRGGDGAAVAAHPHHEVLGFEQVDVLVAGEAAVVTLLALRVEPGPAHAATQVVLLDAVESGGGVVVEDSVADVERVVILLELLVGVERLALTQRPLALALGGAGGRHAAISFVE